MHVALCVLRQALGIDSHPKRCYISAVWLQPSTEGLLAKWIVGIWKECMVLSISDLQTVSFSEALSDTPYLITLMRGVL